MSIKPIDLQTLFAQLEQVGRGQSADRDGQAIKQAVQGAAAQQKQTEDAKGIQKPEAPGEGAEKIRDREAWQGQGGEEKQEMSNKKKSSDEAEVITDPELGGHVDVSG
jgi:hypothetical protein